MNLLSLNSLFSIYFSITNYYHFFKQNLTLPIFLNQIIFFQSTLNQEFINFKNLLEINSSSFIKDYENFLAFNFCYCGFKNDKYFIDLAAEKCIIDSNIYMECETCKKESKTLIKFKFKNLNHTFTSELFSPLKLYNQANKMLQEFKDVDHFYMVNPEIRNKIILNIIFYCKNYDIPFEFLLFYLKK